VDRSGADVLRKRIEEQEHWEQAPAVRDGQQARSDPDRDELRELGSGVRLYGYEQRHEVADGYRALVTWRVCKRLHQGFWERDLIREPGSS
jgi:hypothetical protein